MSEDPRPRVDWLAPPFAGHLFPILELAAAVQASGRYVCRIISTPGARAAAELRGLDFLAILSRHEAAVQAIANTPERVGSSPRRLLSQFRQNLALMAELQAELKTIWGERSADLVVADFTLPVAGSTASELGIRWWTTIPTPCVIETARGTPAYLGGWRPRHDRLGKLRDGAGRIGTRAFKRTIGLIYRRRLRQLGLNGIYRPDGSESVYSPEKILALGAREFEFPCEWPKSVQFIGPVTASPRFAQDAPVFTESAPHVFVSLGTHLPWAKPRAVQLLREVAERTPGVQYHFSHGDPSRREVRSEGNWHEFGYVAYGPDLQRYEAALVHGGTGVTYACLRHGLPLLVWPHDYDQFDHAARIVHHGLGLRCQDSPLSIVDGLARLRDEPEFRERVGEFGARLASYDPCASVLELLDRLGWLRS